MENLDKLYLDSMQSKGSEDKTEYDYLRDNAASEVLNQQVALANAKAGASARLEQELSSLGMAGSGYAANRQNAIDNAYIQGMQNAQAQYGNQLTNIAQTEASNASSANVSRAEELAGNLSKGQNADYYLGQMGLSLDENGNVVNSGNMFNFTADELRGIQNAYDNANGFADYESALNGIKTNAGNSASDSSWGLGWELQTLFNKVSPTNGMVVMLQNNNGSAGNGGQFNNAYLVYRNGRWFPTTKDKYESATNKKYITGTNVR